MNAHTRRGQKDAGGTPNGGAAGAAGANNQNTQGAAGAAAGATGPSGSAGAPGTTGAKDVTLDEIGTLIGAQVKAALKDIVPAEKLTAETITAAVKAALEANKPAAGAQLTAESITAAAGAAVKSVVEGIKKPKPDRGHDEGGSGEEGEGASRGSTRIEVPVAWCKGNLPLHGRQLLNIVTGKGMNAGVPESMIHRGTALGDGIVGRFRMGSKTLTSTGAGTGDEFVPSDLSSELQRRLYLASDLYAALAGNEMDMPSQPYELPISTTRPTFYLNSSEGTAGTASDPGTGSVVLDAKKFMGQVDFTYEVDEDSIIPILPWIQSQLAESAAACFESVIINGDDTATHQDSDTNAITNAAEKAFKGLRKLALAASLKLDMSTGGITAANIRALKKLLGKYGKDLRNLFIVCGVNGDNDFLGVSELITMDKAGARATILTGSVGSIYNIPIITSEANREDLNASGVFDNTTKTKGSILIFNRSRFLLGRRRDFTVETFKDIKTQKTSVVASFRRAFKPVEAPSASVPALAIGYNYTA